MDEKLKDMFIRIGDTLRTQKYLKWNGSEALGGDLARKILNQEEYADTQAREIYEFLKELYG
ncbi:MAG: hypothetical protein FWD45_04540 [Coriobacteriia bacterium]|nr:hypothetical protein [Coriobacteriia bacterium]